jgi:hypothetical protein
LALLAARIIQAMAAYQSVFTAYDQLPLSDATRRAASTADRVDPYVYIGGYLAAADPAFLRREGIDRVVKLFADEPDYYGGAYRHPGVAYIVFDAEDRVDYDIRPAAAQAVRYIQDAIRANERVLVHCHAGVSRSATIVLFHLMINSGYGLDAALARLRGVRPIIAPNAGFMEHLRATDARLQQLRVGDEHRRVAEHEMDRPYTAPPPVLGFEAAGYAARANAEAARAAPPSENAHP